MMNRTRATHGAGVSDAAADGLHAAARALDSSREFATDAAGRIGEGARDLRDHAADLARTGAEW